MDDRKIAIRGTLRAIWGRVCWRFSGTMGQFLFSQKGLTSKWVLLKQGIIPYVLFWLLAQSPSVTGLKGSRCLPDVSCHSGSYPPCSF